VVEEERGLKGFVMEEGKERRRSVKGLGCNKW